MAVGARVALALLSAGGPAAAQAVVEKVPALDYRWELPSAVAAAEPVFARGLRADAHADLRRWQTRGRVDAVRARRHGWYPVADQVIDIGEVAASTPRLLAVVFQRYTYTEGPHGQTHYVVAMWDRRARRRVVMPALFISWPAMLRVLSREACRRLNVERVVRLKDLSAPGPAETSCPALARQTLVPIAERGGERLSAVRVQYGEYEAGSYGQGPYEVTVPLTRAALTLVRPSWREAFVAAPVGGDAPAR